MTCKSQHMVEEWFPYPPERSDLCNILLQCYWLSYRTGGIKIDTSGLGPFNCLCATKSNDLYVLELWSYLKYTINGSDFLTLISFKSIHLIFFTIGVPCKFWALPLLVDTPHYEITDLGLCVHQEYVLRNIFVLWYCYCTYCVNVCNIYSE